MRKVFVFTKKKKTRRQGANPRGEVVSAVKISENICQCQARRTKERQGDFQDEEFSVQCARHSENWALTTKEQAQRSRCPSGVPRMFRPLKAGVLVAFQCNGDVNRIWYLSILCPPPCLPMHSLYRRDRKLTAWKYRKFILQTSTPNAVMRNTEKKKWA